MKGRILITGASGVLGWHLCRYFAQQGYPVEGTYHKNKPSLSGIRTLSLDLEDPYSLRQICGACDYQAVIHTAALTHPDECERDPDRTYAVNVQGTQRLVESIAEESLFIYISTDLVFDGLKGDYREEDPPHPLNYYARSKTEAEEQALRRPTGVVVRLAKIYGLETPFHSCFITWMRERFEKREQVRLFSDQFRTPIYVGDVARALENLIQRRPAHKLYHLGGTARLSRCQFGELYARLFGYDAGLISPVSFDTAGLIVRGKDCSLNSSRFVTEYGFEPAAPADGLKRLKDGIY